VAGFSQGGARAIQLALSGRIPARGFISVVPGGLDQDAFPSLVESARGRPLRGYLVTGVLDQRQELFHFIHRTLNAAGLPCQMEAHPDLAHEFPPDFYTSLQNALQFLFS
jgi:predicted esterase